MSNFDVGTFTWSHNLDGKLSVYSQDGVDLLNLKSKYNRTLIVLYFWSVFSLVAYVSSVYFCYRYIGPETYLGYFLLVMYGLSALFVALGPVLAGLFHKYSDTEHSFKALDQSLNRFCMANPEALEDYLRASHIRRLDSTKAFNKSLLHAFVGDE